tara:strand:- start:964 stop:2076 length:1113 start_codon:yes stop_codon:yes gene_type:complete
MKIYLKIINKLNLNLILFIFILLTYSLQINSSENKIIFKINDYAFTSFDLEKRLEYLDFVGSNHNIDQNLVIDDYISASLFYEYYNNLENKKSYENKINEIFNEIYTFNKKNNKKYSYEIENKIILDNIRIDYIRKIVLENIFNSSLNSLDTSSDEIDLLYNIKIKYINLRNLEFNKLKNNFLDLKTTDYEKILFFLNENNLDYFLKENEINNINKINKKIKENILSNRNFFIIENKQIKSLIFIEKKFETLEGIIVDLYSVKTQNEFDYNFLKCENLININRNQNIINKEYKLIDLNDNLKNNLININDHVKFISDDQNIYIVLCNIKFDKEVLKNINFNKIINLNISELEKKFINKYSETYNLIIFNE